MYFFGIINDFTIVFKKDYNDCAKTTVVKYCAIKKLHIIYVKQSIVKSKNVAAH